MAHLWNFVYVDQGVFLGYIYVAPTKMHSLQDPEQDFLCKILCPLLLRLFFHIKRFNWTRKPFSRSFSLIVDRLSDVKKGGKHTTSEKSQTLC